MIISFTIDGPPVPKPRPRPGRKFFISKRAKDYQEHVGYCAMGTVFPDEWPAKNGRFNVHLLCFFGDQRVRDLDNVAKSVLDGMNKLVWADDGQVDRLVVDRRFDKERPRVEVEISAWA